MQPQYPGNIGSAVRAIHNTGISQLVVVDPHGFDPMRVRWMAPGCDEALAKMRIVATLDEALEGVHLVVASTARHRKGGQPVLSPRELAQDLWTGSVDRVTAILFGREDFGLDREAVDRAASVLRIPTPEHASLNLAQAVMVVCHTLFEQGLSHGLAADGRTVGGSRRGTQRTAALTAPDARDALATMAQIGPAADKLVQLLERVGYTRAASPDKVRQTAQQSLQQAELSIRQVEALRGMVARVDWALEHPDLDWTAPRKKR